MNIDKVAELLSFKLQFLMNVDNGDVQVSPSQYLSFISRLDGEISLVMGVRS